MPIKLIKLILHYSRLDLTQSLVAQVPDSIVIDAKGDYIKISNEEVIKINNNGFSQNWNKALHIIWDRDWDWCWLANNDIILKTPNFFEIIQKELQQYENIVMASAIFNAAWENCRPSVIKKTYFTHGVEFTAPFLHRKIIERSNFFDIDIKNGFGIDLIYAHNIKLLDYQAIVIPEAEFYHYGSASGAEVFGNIDNYLQQGFNELFAFIDKKTKEMNRTEVINTIIKTRNYKSYCEIGYGFGENYNAIDCEKKICVDPFTTANEPLKMTSSLFFDTCKDFFDIIFIDGDHRSPHVFADYYFACKKINKKGCIVFHDVNPPTEWHTRDYSSFASHGGEWCGDAYLGFIKSVNANKSEFYTIGSDFGIGIIDFAKERTRDLLPMPANFKEFAKNRRDYLNLITPDELIKELK